MTTKRKTLIEVLAPEEGEPTPVVLEAPVMVDVKIIRDSGPTCLVEWTEHDDLWRAYVPKEVIQHLRVSADELAAGTPYGVRWEKLIEVHATPERVAQALRRRGIWTAEQLNGRWPEAKTAMIEATAMDLVGLLRRVEAYEQEKTQ
jgi:hypothetical protein